MLNDNAGAYSDMSEAQKIEYSKEYDALHAQIKRDRETDAKPSLLSAPTPQGIPNMPNLAQLMNNPAFMNMVQSMMYNPDFKKGSSRIFKKIVPDV